MALKETHTHICRNTYPHIFPHFAAVVRLLTPEAKNINRGKRKAAGESQSPRRGKEAMGRAGNRGGRGSGRHILLIK